MKCDELDALIAKHSTQLKELDNLRSEISINIRRLEKLRPTKTAKSMPAAVEGEEPPKQEYDETLPTNEYSGAKFTDDEHTAAVEYCCNSLKDLLAKKGK